MSYLPSNTAGREEFLGCRVRRASPSKQKQETPTQPWDEPWQHGNDSHLVTVFSNGSSSSVFLSKKAKEPKGFGFALAAERLHCLASSSRRAQVSPVICRSWKRWITTIDRGSGSGGNAKKYAMPPPAPPAMQQHHLLVRARLRSRWKGSLIPGEGSCTPLG